MMEAERESEIELMITAGLKAPKPLLDKVVAGGVSAACALQMLCTNKHAPWVEKVAGISACVSAFAQCIERHACAAAVDASNRLELFTFCLQGMCNALYYAGDSPSAAAKKRHHKHVLPTIARALTHHELIMPQDGKAGSDARIHLFYLVSNTVKPHTLSDFTEEPHVQIAPLVLELLGKGDAGLQRFVGAAHPMAQTRLMLVNLLHRLVDLEPVQLLLWNRKSDLAALVQMIDAQQNDISMDLLDIFIEMGKTSDHGGLSHLWALPGFVDMVTSLARRSAFSRSTGYGDPECKSVTSRVLALGCLVNMSVKSSMAAWKAGAFEVALINVRAGDQEQSKLACDLIDILASDLEGVRKHGTGAVALALLEQAIGISAALPEQTATTLLRLRQKMKGLEELATRPSQQAAILMRACRTCSKASTPEKPFEACARCNCAFYCSRECQVKDWPKHKAECKRRAKLTAESGLKRPPVRSYEQLSANYLSDNIIRLAMAAKSHRIELKDLVLYLDFCFEPSADGSFPSVELFSEQDAPGRLKRKEWWVDDIRQTYESSIEKRAECCAAGDRRVQIVYLCTFEGNNFYGGRWMMSDEHSEKLMQVLQSKEGKQIQGKMQFNEMRRMLSRFAANCEAKDRDPRAPLVGERVIIRGLLGQTELNGKTGDAEGFNAESSRYRVRLESGTVVMIKPEKLEPTRYDGCPELELEHASFLFGDGESEGEECDDSGSEDILKSERQQSGGSSSDIYDLM
jgi:hypothetical protein